MLTETISTVTEQELLFNNSFGIKLTAQNVIQEIKNFINADPKRDYKVIIGSDSEKQADLTADFVTAVVVHRVGNGGRYFWRRIENQRRYHSLRDRILDEVLLSLDIAKSLLATAKNSDMPKFDFEIHVDVGENGETKVMIQEVVGMIRANNFEPRTKPNSYAASKVADRHV